MNMTHSITHTYRFTELRKDIRDPETGTRVSVVTSVVLSIELLDKPDSTGRTYFIDHTFLGWTCRKDGTIDERQGHPHSGVAPYLYSHSTLLAAFVYELALLSGNRELINETRQWVLDTGGD